MMILFQAIVDSIHSRTGQVIPAAHASVIAAQILEGRKPDNPLAYVQKAIVSEKDPKGLFLPSPESAHPSLPAVDQHAYEPDGEDARCASCGLPESNRRHLEAS